MKLDLQAVEAAAALLAPHVRRTPVIEVEGADFGLPHVRPVFKLEFMQHAGSFKSRGAFLHMLTRPVPAAGVVAASGGNHGAAVAFAAQRLGVKATIFVPTVASPAKVAQIRACGAELRIGGDRYADALAASQDFVEATGALPIHAYDDAETIVGQATCGREFIAQAPGLDAMLVAVGGGGLIGGFALALSGSDGRLPLVGVEPGLAPTLQRALAAGRPVDAPAGGIAADSLAPRRIGERVFPIARRFVESVLVTDDAIAAAQRALWGTLRIAAEPGGVTGLAALLSGRFVPPPGSRIAVVISGGNTSAVQLP